MGWRVWFLGVAGWVGGSHSCVNPPGVCNCSGVVCGWGCGICGAGRAGASLGFNLGFSSGVHATIPSTVDETEADPVHNVPCSVTILATPPPPSSFERKRRRSTPSRPPCMHPQGGSGGAGTTRGHALCAQSPVTERGFGCRLWAASFRFRRSPRAVGSSTFREKKVTGLGCLAGERGGEGKYHAVFEEFVEVRLRYRARDLGRRIYWDGVR